MLLERFCAYIDRLPCRLVDRKVDDANRLALKFVAALDKLEVPTTATEAAITEIRLLDGLNESLKVHVCFTCLNEWALIELLCDG
jgi:hypothetical protein